MKNLETKRTLWFVLTFFVVNCNISFAQSEIVNVDAFNKVIISPHIEAEFVKGDKESVTIESLNESRDKLNVEVNGGTLRVFLDDAKMATKSKKVDYEGWKQKVPVYKGTIARVVISYKDLDELSLRGEEEYTCKDLLAKERFVLSIYGDSEVTFSEVNFDNLKTTIYGESELIIKKGTADNQKLTLYGDSEVLVSNVKSKTAKIIAYGEGEVKVNVTERLKVTAYGEADIYYKGNPKIDKGIVIGEATIQSM